ncbi:MAG: inorganic phosphate transporter, partial [Solirubrobacterales bacterium]
MSANDIVLVIVVGTALVFDFTNGFHDTANVVATSISTHAMPPRIAVAYAAAFNFLGAFISLAVAATVATGVVDSNVITPTVVFAGLVGAIIWNLATWYFGLPSSSSHALIGGVVGSAFAAAGSAAIISGGLFGKVLIPAVIAPVVAFVVGAIAINIVYGVLGRERPGPVNRGFRLGQVVSGGMLALAHGTNDAQKTMGVITLALITNGNLPSDSAVPTWVVISAATAISLGTYVGGWRIIRTTGTRIIKMDAAQGFSAQGAGAAVILASSHYGFPLSTTHVINGGVMGAGAGKKVSAVRWGVAGNIVVAWLLTIPAAGAMGAATYGFSTLFGSGATGPVVIALLG